MSKFTNDYKPILMNKSTNIYNDDRNIFSHDQGDISNRSFGDANSFVCQIPMNYQNFTKRKTNPKTESQSKNRYNTSNTSSNFSNIKIELDSDIKFTNDKIGKAGFQSSTPIFSNYGNGKNLGPEKISKTETEQKMKSVEETYQNMISLAATYFIYL